MVPKSGARLPKSPISLTDIELAGLISAALQEELGGSRRATKTIMAWTGVSDHTARAWLHGRKTPSSLRLLALAAHSRPVMALVLQLTGRGEVELAMDLEPLEASLDRALTAIRALRAGH